METRLLLLLLLLLLPFLINMQHLGSRKASFTTQHAAVLRKGLSVAENVCK